MGEAGGGEEKGAPLALSLFRFHLPPFPPETPDTQASYTITPATQAIPAVEKKRPSLISAALLTWKMK